MEARDGGYFQGLFAAVPVKLEQSWEDAARDAVETAVQSLRDLRVGRSDQAGLKIEDGKVGAFRTRVELSFKYDT